MLFLGFLAALALVGWVALLLHPARPWDMRPVAEEQPEPAAPEALPDVAIVVPARNEAESLPATLEALATQDYAGRVRVVVANDRSEDSTGAVAEARSVTVVTITELQPGWAGKVWAMQRGFDAALAADEPKPRYVLFTDADILHAPSSLRRLVSESVRDDLALNSRMARLSCESPAEKWLIPAFAWFFAVLYPMRRVADARSRVAAAAGGCMLVETAALEAMGGLEPIRDRIIDDVSLARAVKERGGLLRLQRSERDVVSARRYPLMRDVWRMVRRTAFTELRRSWARLAACVLALVVAFLVPPLAVVTGAVALLSGDVVRGGTLLALGGAAWGACAQLYAPAVRRFGLASWRAWTLPFAGLAYGAMTVDSALHDVRGVPNRWRDAG